MANFYPISAIPFQLVNPDTGALASGFTLEAYLSGTTTPTAMYVDAAGTPAGLSITMNSAGYPAVSGSVVNIYLSKTIDYKFILKDNLGGTEWTLDGIPALEEAVTVVTYLNVAQMILSNVQDGAIVTTESYYPYSATVPAKGGANYQIMTLVEWQTLTGLTTPDGYVDHVLNNGNVAVLLNRRDVEVTQCGAIAGVDSTLQIQALINTMTSTSGSLVIRFPNYGSWVVGTLTITSKFGLSLIGTNSSIFSCIQVKNKISCTNVGDFKVNGLKFVGNAVDITDGSFTAPTTGNFCFELLDNCANWVHTSNDFLAFDKAYYHDPAAASTGTYVFTCRDSYFNHNNYDFEGGLVLHYTVSGNTFSETRTGNMKFSRAGEVHYTGNKHENGINVLTGYNVEFTNTSGQSCKSIVSNNTFHEFAGFRFNNVDGVQVFGNTNRIHNTTGLDAVLIDGASQHISIGINEFNGFQGGSSFASRGIYVTGTAANIDISSGCSVYNYGTALLSDSGQLLSIKGADLRGNTTAVWIQNQSATDRVNLVDCLLQGGTDAIQSTGNAARWSERGCTILGGAITNTDGWLEQYNQTGVWTPVPTNLTVVGTPTYTGTFTKIGKLYHCVANISSTTSTAATAGSTFFNGLPATPANDSTVASVTTGGTQGAVGLLTNGGQAFVGGWTASSNIRISFTFEKA